MNRYVILTLGLCAFGACGLPSLSDIHLSSCLRQAATQRKVCSSDANELLDGCEDVVCAREFLTAEQTCWDQYADAANACIADVERGLKE